jgi:hypothetical protein
MPGLKIDIGGDNCQLFEALRGARETNGDFATEVKVRIAEVFKANVYEKLFDFAKESIGSPIEGIKASLEAGSQLELLHRRIAETPRLP